MKYEGKLAVITGASSGIGAAFADELARRGADVVLVARRTAQLDQLAARIRHDHRVEAHVVSLDLTDPTAADVLRAQVDALGGQLEIVVNNAGFGSAGRFADLAPDRLAQEVALNVAAVVAVSRAFLPALVAQRSGALINVASIAAFNPAPYMATYAASKAFVLSLSESLNAEHCDDGIRVLALCPGPVPTEFQLQAGVPSGADRSPSMIGQIRTAEQVVRTALAALDRNRSSVIPGPLNAAQTLFTRILPRRMSLPIIERAMRPARDASTLVS